MKINTMYNDGPGQLDNMVPLVDMISIVQLYIYHMKGVVIKIIPPRNDRELQLLGKAYDCAVYFFQRNPQFGYV